MDPCGFLSIINKKKIGIIVDMVIFLPYNLEVTISDSNIASLNLLQKGEREL